MISSERHEEFIYKYLRRVSELIKIRIDKDENELKRHYKEPKCWEE